MRGATIIRAMVSDALKRNAELQKEIEELRSVRKTLEEELKRSTLEREYLEFQLEKFRRMLFGTRSEKLAVRPDGLQLDLFEEARREIESEEVQERETISYERKKRRGNRRPIPEEIQREQVVVDVDPELRVCPDCGEEMECFGADTSEDLEYIPALLFVVEYLIKKYACKKCQSGVIQGKRPPRPIPKGRPGAGLLAYVLVSKYQDHLPLHRLERIFGRHGMELSRKTLCDWVQAMARLLRPIVEAMKRKLLEEPLLQADETPTKAQNPEVKGKTSSAYIWSYGIPDGEVVYDFTMGRSTAGPAAFLGEYSGYLQSDSYSVYKSLERQGKTVHIGCWAHARRKFYDAREESPEFSKLVLTAIQKLFRIERKAKSEEITGEGLLALRRSESRPILEGLKRILEAKRVQVTPRSGLGEAITYALGNWAALVRYIDIPEAPIDNNGAERSLRGITVGRKNWLFIGHPNAGPNAAVILSLIETCRRLGVEPFEYLKSVITALAKKPAPDRIEGLTPRRWLESERAKKAENFPAASA